MKLRVLGCHGGETPTLKATSFLVDEKILMDAGSLTRSLSLEEQRQLKKIVISHSHLDHVRDLGLWIDNIFASRPEPIEVYCTAKTAAGLKEHYFNNVIWPDFLAFPNPTDPEGRPMVMIHEIPNEGIADIGDGYRVQTVEVVHPVETVSTILHTPSGKTIAYCGDTGPTDHLWEVLNEIDDLRAVIVEVSFTDDMAELAKASGHLTPATLRSELQKFQPKYSDCAKLVYGLKPAFYERLLADIPKLDIPGLKILHPANAFDF